MCAIVQCTCSPISKGSRQRWVASLVISHIHGEAIAPVESRESKDGEGDPNSSCIKINFNKFNNKKA